MQQNVSVAFFDIGETLGTVSVAPSGIPISFDVYSHVPPILEYLKGAGIRIGVISNTGTHAGSLISTLLSKSVIWPYLSDDLLIFSADIGLEKNSPEIFIRASQLAKVDVQRCIYVGEDSWERMHAANAGMRVCPHPILVRDLINGDRLRFVRLSAPESLPAAELRAALQGKSFVPLHVFGRDRSKLVGITTTSGLTQFANAQLDVEPLGAIDIPLLSDLYLLRDDRAVRTGFLSFEGQSAAFFAGDQADWLLSSTSEGLLVAIAAGRSVEEFHFEEAHHGHNLKLTPDPALLTLLDAMLAAMPFAVMDAGISNELNAAERDAISRLTDKSIETRIGPYVGKAPLGDGGPNVRSRHIHSDDNPRIVRALGRDLSSISDRLRVRLCPFTHEGRQLFNVEAELGPSDAEEFVLVTAHLDSTAAFSPPYKPPIDPAPGADDNASGIAGVLTAAEAIVSLAALWPIERAIRFVLFNAEEHGLVGSKAYARDEAAKATRIVAVLQMDMIGYNVEAPRSWELHAGYWPSPEVQQRSLALAERVSHLASQVSPELERPQLYISRGPLPADRDPAEGRSDHAPFHERGYPALAASEDFFAGPDPGAPAPEGNPHYHKAQDTFVDARYAADIARAIAASAWVLARKPS